jgi:hypothetical protein
VLFREVRQQGTIAQFALRVRCPGCRDRVTLESLENQTNDIQFVSEGENEQHFNAGQRICPNLECRTHLFVIYQRRQGQLDVLGVYPPERIDFDDTGLPERVLAAIEEATACHAQACYVAAAMMVRKTLEEVCLDHEAGGSNLKDRLAVLGSKIVLPQALLDGLDALRLLGNDAAHVESRDYEQVGKQEVDVALDVTKEILKATYQLDSIVGRLTALQRQQETEPGQ